MDDLHCVRLDASMVHPSPLSPPVFRSVDRNWDESEVPLSSSQPSAHICYGQKKKQLKLVRVPIHYYVYRQRFSDLVEEFSFRPAGSHSHWIIRLVGFLPSLGSRQVHARAARERKHDSVLLQVRFPRPNEELARRLILGLPLTHHYAVIKLNIRH